MSIVALSSFFCFARWRTLFRPVRTAFRAPHGGDAGPPRGSPALPAEGGQATAPSAATRPAAEPRGLIVGAPGAARICSGSAAQPFCSAKPEIHRVGPEFTSWSSGLTEIPIRVLKLTPNPVNFTFAGR